MNRHAPILVRGLVLAVAAAMSASAAPSNAADIVKLANGNMLSGRIVRETASEVTIEAYGIQTTLDKRLIRSIERDRPAGPGATDTTVQPAADRPDSSDAPQAPPAPQWAIAVGPEGIAEEEYEVYLKRAANDALIQVHELTPMQRADVMQHAIDDELLFQAGLAIGTHRQPYIRQQIIGQYRAAMTTAQILPQNIDPKEIEAYYNAHKDSFIEPTTLELRYLFYPPGTDEAEVLAAHTQAKFNPDALTHWQSAGVKKEGELAGNLEKAHMAKVFQLQQGEVSDIITDGFGIKYIFHCLSRKTGGLMPLEQARAKVIHLLIEQKQKTLDRDLDAALRQQSPGGLTTEELAFRQAMEARIHRTWHIRQRVINTFVHDTKLTRDQLLPLLRERIDVKVKIEP